MSHLAAAHVTIWPFLFRCCVIVSGVKLAQFDCSFSEDILGYFKICGILNKAALNTCEHFYVNLKPRVFFFVCGGGKYTHVSTVTRSCDGHKFIYFFSKNKLLFP